MRSPCSTRLPCQTYAESNAPKMHSMQISLPSQIVPFIKQPSLRATFVCSRI